MMFMQNSSTQSNLEVNFYRSVYLPEVVQNLQKSTKRSQASHFGTPESLCWSSWVTAPASAKTLGPQVQRQSYVHRCAAWFFTGGIPQWHCRAPCVEDKIYCICKTLKHIYVYINIHYTELYYSQEHRRIGESYGHLCISGKSFEGAPNISFQARWGA